MGQFGTLSDRRQLQKIHRRGLDRGVEMAITIEDMFATGHDAANRETVIKYQAGDLPLVGLGIRADRKEADKIFKGAKLHD